MMKIFISKNSKRNCDFSQDRKDYDEKMMTHNRK